MPKVSIIMPSYNLAAFIGEAIESVIAQTFEDWELLIEDDGSTDDSAAVIARYNDSRIKAYCRFENIGANPTTNNLVRTATGEYLCPLAADDVWLPEKLAKQVEFLDANSSYGIVFGWPHFINSAGLRMVCQGEHFNKPPDMGRAAWREQFKAANSLFISTCMYRRALHDELGLYSEDLPILADMEWYVRITEKHDLKVMQEPLAKIRVRDGNANLSSPTEKTLIQSAYDMEKVHARNYAYKGTKKNVMIATPFYEVRGYAPYIQSLVHSCAALTTAKMEYSYVQMSGDSYIWRARNAMVQRFMDSDCSHLMFIDSDEGWDLEGFLRVIKSDEDIVGAAYPVKNNWEHYGVLPIGQEGTEMANGHGIPKVNSEGLIHAERVPTGFMKISRRVFEVLREAYPDNWYWDAGGGVLRRIWNHFGHIVEDHIAYGEDISFCKRWTASGGSIFIEPRVHMSHLGIKEWRGCYHEFLTRQPGGKNDPQLNQQTA